MAFKFTNPKVWLGTNLDLSSYVRTVTVEEEAEQLDVGTFSNPRGIEYGRKSGTVTLAGAWGIDLVESTSAYVGVSTTLKIQPSAAISDYINATVSTGVPPWTEITADQMGEFQWVFNLLSDVTTS